ncbi:MAG TPA: phosphatidylglycerol lysyltransferase domain-containing protein, partial [Vicinamibacteria bacterium]|nr:phosphatidylglycerol lysyltransferase domain-containing protein [Vicinamibacteria bacterium]
MEALLVKYGYAILFLGVLVEGEAFVVAAGVLAHRGLLSLPIVIALSIAANSVTNQFYYFASRARGREWLESRYGSHKRYHQIVEIMARHGRWLLVFSRFAYGFRMLICAACGALGMEVLPFTVLSILSGAVWAVPTALASYYAGGTVIRLLHHIHRYGLWVVLGVVLIAATFVGIGHVRRALSTRDMRFSDLHALVPFLIGLMGLLNVLSAILPRSPRSVLFLEAWLPLEVMQRSRPVMLFAGVALLQVTVGLSRRKSLAWYVATSALAVSFVSHLGRGFDLHHSLAAGLLLVYLLYFRKRFYALSDPGSVRVALAMIPLLATLVLLFGGVGLSEMETRFGWSSRVDPWGEAFREGVLIASPRAFPLSPRAAEFQTSLQLAGWLARLYLLVLLLRPVALKKRLETPSPSMLAIAREHGRQSLSALATEPDKRHLLVAGGRGFVAYAVHRALALSCGDPVCPEEAFEASAREFLEQARTNRWTPCFYLVAEERLGTYRGLDLESLEIAEEAVVGLEGWSPAGAGYSALRSMVEKGSAAGLTVEPYDRALSKDPGLDEQL